jgi:hypothetical protein
MSVYAPSSLPMGDAPAPVGFQRDIGTQILLSVVTLGVYALFWAYRSHEDIREHTGDGIGGLAGVLIWMFAFPVSLFLVPLEIEKMYHRDGQESPVRASTAAWFLLFGVPWFVKCQRALNSYWASKGAGFVS